MHLEQVGKVLAYKMSPRRKRREAPGEGHACNSTGACL